MRDERGEAFFDTDSDIETPQEKTKKVKRHELVKYHN